MAKGSTINKHYSRGYQDALRDLAVKLTREGGYYEMVEWGINNSINPDTREMWQRAETQYVEIH